MKCICSIHEETSKAMLIQEGTNIYLSREKCQCAPGIYSQFRLICFSVNIDQATYRHYKYDIGISSLLKYKINARHFDHMEQ